MKKSNVTAAALAAIVLLGPVLGFAKEAAVNTPHPTSKVSPS